MASDERKFGVQAGALHDSIWVGRINKAGTMFTQKENAAAEVFNAVAEYVNRHHDGAATIRVNGHRIDIDVTKETADVHH